MTSGVNEKLYTGDINYIPSVNTSEWQVPVDGIKVDGKSIDVQAGLDTKPTAKFWLSGSMFMRESLANLTMAQISGSSYEAIEYLSSPNNTMYMYRVPCDTNSTVTFTLGGNDYPVPVRVLSAWPGANSSEPRCLADIIPTPDKTMVVGLDIVLTSSFLSTVYTVFKFGDAPQVGLASLSDAARDVVPERIDGGAKPTGTGTMPGYTVLPQPPVGSARAVPQPTESKTSAASAVIDVASGLVIALSALGSVLYVSA
jgi:hypothetical protein